MCLSLTFLHLTDLTKSPRDGSYSTFTPNEGQWQMKGAYHFNKPSTLKNWAVVVFSEEDSRTFPRRTAQESVINLVRAMKEGAQYQCPSVTEC